MKQFVRIITLFALTTFISKPAHALCTIAQNKQGETVALLTKKYPKRAQMPYKVKGKLYRPVENTKDFTQKGKASWYGRPFHGKLTANGETYNMFDYTAAHPTLPIPSCVRVTNLENGKSVVVRINDRGPFKSDLGTDTSDRIIDLSMKAALELKFKSKGVAPVKLEFLGAEVASVR